MGESSDDSNLFARISNWTKSHVGKRPTQVDPVLPVTNTQADDITDSSNVTPINHAHDGAGTAGIGRTTSHNNKLTASSSDDTTASAANLHNTQATGTQSATISSEKAEGKPPWGTRLRAGSKRFLQHSKDAICHSWINVLLIFVPVGIAVEVAGLQPEIIFAMNAIAVIPLAGLLAHATESVASRLGDTLGALLNVSFGNAVELIIFIIALVKNEIRIVQASLLGSILANLLLILGMAFLLGGLRFQEQIYNSTVTQMSACLLSLSVVSLLLPTAFHASFSNNDSADRTTLKISRGTSVVLLLVYILYLLFQLKSHAYLYESTPQHIIDEESHPGVLHDMLDTSSSSSSSDSSSSDSDSSSGSQTTAKRIKRAFRNRKRRQSSASSKDTASVPSTTISSPSQEHTNPLHNRSGSMISTPGSITRTHSALDVAVLSGDEADGEGHSRRRSDAPTVRDFQAEHTSSTGKSLVSKKEKKHRKRHHKHKKSSKKDRRDAEKSAEADAIQVAAQEQLVAVDEEPTPPRVDFADTIEEQDAAPGSVPKKRPFNLRQLSSRPVPRPSMPALLSNNVFVARPTNPPATTGIGAPMMPRVAHQRLRKTTSLPDRLNRQEPSEKQLPRPTSDMNHVPANASEVPRAEVEDEEKPPMSRTAAVMLLLISTGLVAVCAEFLVDAIPEMTGSNSNISEAFIGLIILPIVGNAAEHVTAVTVAAKNKMDLAIGVAVGSSIQIAIFVTPLVVILGWCMDKEMTLYFTLFETIALFVTAFVVNFLVLDGRSNYLEGALLIAAYVIIAVCAFFYPNSDQQSALGGNAENGEGAVEGAITMVKMLLRA